MRSIANDNSDDFRRQETFQRQESSINAGQDDGLAEAIRQSKLIEENKAR